MANVTIPPACPACGGLTPTLLPIASRRKPFAYYLCRWCNYTWMVRKGSVNSDRVGGPSGSAAMTLAP